MGGAPNSGGIVGQGERGRGERELSRPAQAPPQPLQEVVPSRGAPSRAGFSAPSCPRGTSAGLHPSGPRLPPLRRVAGQRMADPSCPYLKAPDGALLGGGGRSRLGATHGGSGWATVRVRVYAAQSGPCCPSVPAPPLLCLFPRDKKPGKENGRLGALAAPRETVGSPAPGRPAGRTRGTRGDRCGNSSDRPAGRAEPCQPAPRTCVCARARVHTRVCPAESPGPMLVLLSGSGSKAMSSACLAPAAQSGELRRGRDMSPHPSGLGRKAVPQAVPLLFPPASLPPTAGPGPFPKTTKINPRATAPSPEEQS